MKNKNIMVLCSSD